MNVISARVIPNAKKSRILEEDGKIRIYVNAPAVDGKANKAVTELLAEYYGIRKSMVRILRGEKSRDKIIEISD